MTSAPQTVLRHLRRLASAREPAEDAELLARYVACRDEEAFTGIVRRHGPMVLGVCRRLLRRTDDAEDAFQITFLVLVRKAATIRKPGSLASWLHGVACRVAGKLRAAGPALLANTRTTREESDPSDEITWRELRGVLDAELARVPETYRAPLVHCYLQGQTQDEAARQLGWTQITLRRRLERGRALLKARLTRRGVTLSAALLAPLLSAAAAEAMSPALLTATRLMITGTVPARLGLMTEGVVRSMTAISWKTSMALALTVVVAAVGWWSANLSAEPRPASVATPIVRRTVAEPPPKPQAPPAKTGQIYFHRVDTLSTIQPDGTKPTELPAISARDRRNYQPHSPRLSPDGKRLAFGRGVVGGDGFYPPDKIHVRDVTKQADAELLAELPGSELNNWVWSPDGTKLAFVSWDKDNPVRNWVVDVKTKKIEEVKLPRLKTKKFGELQMSIQDWSPDGQWFLASSDGLHVVKTDGTGARQLVEAPNLMGGSSRFSPDGKKVLYVTRNEDKSKTLNVVDSAGGKPRAIVEAKNFTDLRACWSPDGKRIAYIVTLLDDQGERGGETTLFVCDADGKNTVTVITEKHDPQELRMTLTDWR